MDGAGQSILLRQGYFPEGPDEVWQRCQGHLPDKALQSCQDHSLEGLDEITRKEKSQGHFREGPDETPQNWQREFPRGRDEMSEKIFQGHFPEGLEEVLQRYQIHFPSAQDKGPQKEGGCSYLRAACMMHCRTSTLQSSTMPLITTLVHDASFCFNIMWHGIAGGGACV